MKNIVMKRKGDLLIIEIDLGKRFGLSKSRKTKIVASTEGNVAIDGSPEIKIGINAYVSAK
jgi:hypothetical protein